MKWLAMVLLTVACGGKAKSPATAGAGSGSDGAAIYAKKVALGWGFQPSGSSRTDVFLTATDETGKAVSYPLGTFDGECKVATPAPEMKALTGVHCTTGASNTDLHAVVDGDNVIILKATTPAGAALDPMSREEVTRITAPAGAKIEAAS